MENQNRLITAIKATRDDKIDSAEIIGLFDEQADALEEIEAINKQKIFVPEVKLVAEPMMINAVKLRNNYYYKGKSLTNNAPTATETPMPRFWVSFMARDSDSGKVWSIASAESVNSLEEAKKAIRQARNNWRVVSAWVDTYDVQNNKTTVLHECYVNQIGDIECTPEVYEDFDSADAEVLKAL